MADEVENVIIEEQSLENADVKLFGGEEETQIDEVKEPPKEVKDVKESPKEDKEEDEEDKDKEPEEEQEEDVELTPIEGFKRPTFKQIAEKYPNFLKDFPEMRDVIGREHEFTEIFATVDDAKNAKENDKDFTFFSDKVTSGDAKAFLEVVRDSGKTDLNKFVNNFLPALKSIDSNLYTETTAPFIVDLLQSAYFDADRAGNDNLKNSILHFSKYVFNDHRYATGEIKLKPKEEKVPEEKKEEDKGGQKEFLQRYEDTYKEVNDNLQDKLQEFIEIPEGLNEFVAEALPKSIIKIADELLKNDPAHQKKMSSLWDRAAKNHFDYASRQQIITTVMNRYKEVIPEIRRKELARATKGTTVRSESRKELTGSGKSGGAPTRRSAKEIDWKQTSDEDLFNGNAKYKS